MEPSESFCILPWMHLFADEQGVMWPCCRSVCSEQPNREDADNRPVHVDRPEGLVSAMNTRAMRHLRQDMLAGRKPAACERCYMVERLGIRSHRIAENERRQAEIAAALQATSADGAITVALRTADIRLGNKCNLRCRMCSPQSSKVLLPEWADRYGVPVSDPRLDVYRAMNWFEEPRFWQSLEALELEHINFAGGEPLLIDAMYDFMARMVANGRAAAISLSYNTNLTVLPQRLRQLWPAFRAVKVTGSIDGYGRVNEFIRDPSQWSVVDAHLRELDEDFEAFNLHGGLSTNTAVQIYNVFRLGDLLDYLADNFQHLDLPNLSVVTHPGHLDLRVLPSDLKRLARDRLLTAIDRSGGRWRGRWGVRSVHLVAAMHGLVAHMESEDRSDLLPEFLEWARHQDRFRRQSTPDAIPELASLFERSSLPRAPTPTSSPSKVRR